MILCTRSSMAPSRTLTLPVCSKGYSSTGELLDPFGVDQDIPTRSDRGTSRSDIEMGGTVVEMPENLFATPSYANGPSERILGSTKDVAPESKNSLGFISLCTKRCLLNRPSSLPQRLRSKLCSWRHRVTRDMTSSVVSQSQPARVSCCSLGQFSPIALMASLVVTVTKVRPVCGPGWVVD